MAVEKHEPNHEHSRADAGADRPAGKEPGVVGLAVLSVVSIASAVWNALTRDGTLAAAGRQGLDELGAALKAFPDTIQVQESGTIFNPTQGEIAADRKQEPEHYWVRSYSASDMPRHPWPSEVANENRHLPSKDHGNGHENGHDAGASM